ncbi:hypothetical protein [Acidovorax sp. LjRoot66]|uniref:hypothetical protein n=1 Tax=Acidovorax sp. LjRoot66 TaxID=3342334 RepID=UPI003F504C69
MGHGLNFALLFNFPAGRDAAREALKPHLPGAEPVRAALVFENNVLNFQKNPLHGEIDEIFEHELSVFPLHEPDVETQRRVFITVLQALRSFAGEVDVLAEPELLDPESS